MSHSPLTYDRNVSPSMATHRHTIAEVVAEGAALALAHAPDMPNTGKRFLSEAKRPDYSVRRARMFMWWQEYLEWMAYAPREIATHPAEQLRGIILGHQPAPVPCLVSSIQHENLWNNRSDEMERWYLLEKTAVRLDGLIHGWNGQVEATRLGLDIAHAARHRTTISFPGC